MPTSSSERPPFYHTIWECGDGTWGHGVSLVPLSEEFFWADLGFETEDAALEATTPRAHGYTLVLNIPSNASRIDTLNDLAETIIQKRASSGDDLFDWADE